MPSLHSAFVSLPADTGRDPVTVVGLVLETATGLRRVAGARLEHAHQLPAQSFDVLIRLARSPGGRARMSDLAAQTSLTPSGLTRAIDRLQEAGLVERAACTEDRRGLFAFLTVAGERRMDEVMRCHAADLESILASALTSAERQELVSLLRKLRDEVNPDAARVSENLTR